EKGFTVDKDGFNEEMQSQRNRARAARQVEDSFSVQSAVLGDITVESTFDGYDKTSLSSELLVVIENDEIKESASAGNTAQLIFKTTPFYAEMGGQAADMGVIKAENGEIVATIVDVKRAPNGQHLHTAEM